MALSRGHKSAHSRAGHKSKNKKTYKGRFTPLEDPEKVLKYIKRLRPKMFNSVQKALHN